MTMHVEAGGELVGVSVPLLLCGSWDQIQFLRLGNRCPLMI